MIDGSVTLTGATDQLIFGAPSGNQAKVTIPTLTGPFALSFIEPGLPSSNFILDNSGGFIIQPTSNTTGVTLNARAGIISMFAALAGGATASFMLTNSYIKNTSIVILLITNTVSGTSFISPFVEY